MLESLKYKQFNPSVNKQDMVSQKFTHTLQFPMMGNTCTDELCTATTVHFL